MRPRTQDRRRSTVSGRVAAAVLVSATLAAQPHTAVRPQDDVFTSANADWLASARIPDDRVSYGTFTEIADRIDADVQAIVEDVIAGRARVNGATREQVIALYTSAVDEARIAARGAAPLADELARIGAIRSPSGLAAETGHLSSLGAGGPFDGGPIPDPDRPGQIVVRILPGGTLLPDLRYYLDDATPFAEARREYETYLGTIFELTAHDRPRDLGHDVLALETEIARAQWQTGAPDRPGRFTLRELAAAMPGWDWTAWAQPQGLDRVPALMLERPGFFQRFTALVPQVPLSVWRGWLVARYVTAAAPYLSQPFDVARFRFFGATLTGQVEPRPRWKRGVTMVSGYLGDAIGRIYVERFLADATRAQSRRLLDTLVDAFRASLRDASMETAAKRQALTRLASITPSVGAPAAWHDYRGLELRPDDLYGNWMRAVAFESAGRERAAAGALTRAWAAPPQTANAYYAAATNEIVIPAALLQPPIFDAGGDAARNYGALGALAGHEIAHAFGASEEPADAIGLAVALRAYHLSLKGTVPPVVDGLTGDQRFFLGWARMWRAKERPEYTRSLAAGPYRSPRDRANAAASSVDGFYEAFAVKPGDRMFRPPEQRLKVR